MTSREALDRMFWRFGLVFLLMGTLSLACGAALTAWNAKLVHFPGRFLYWPIYVLAGTALGGLCWLAATAYREGAFSEHHDGALAADHVGIPAIVILAWITVPDQWTGPTGIVVGIILAVCGWRSMRIAAESLKAK